MRVHPALRRQGIGEKMLRLLVTQAREAGRTRLMGPFVREGGPGMPWSKRFGFEPAPGTPEQLADTIRAEEKKFAELVRRTGATAD